eukprot:SAG22_NODE_138_length_18031_cov_5.796621_5_plen_183_part_00
MAGFGPFEMIEMCNQLGIEPVITTTATSSPVELAALVEYCLGDAATTPMGQQRAADGHPATYDVKYFELGCARPPAPSTHSHSFRASQLALQHTHPRTHALCAATLQQRAEQRKLRPAGRGDGGQGPDTRASRHTLLHLPVQQFPEHLRTRCCQGAAAAGRRLGAPELAYLSSPEGTFLCVS